MRPPLHRSLLLWAGAVFATFIVFAWMDSRRHESACYGPPKGAFGKTIIAKSKDSAVHVLVRFEAPLSMLPPSITGLFSPSKFAFERDPSAEPQAGPMLPRADYYRGKADLVYHAGIAMVKDHAIPMPLVYGEDIIYLALPYWLILSGFSAFWLLLVLPVRTRLAKRAVTVSTN